MEQCRREIAAIEDQLRAGHPDVHGLCLALADWSEELRIIEAEREKPPGLIPAAGRTDPALGQLLMEYSLPIMRDIVSLGFVGPGALIARRGGAEGAPTSRSRCFLRA